MLRSLCLSLLLTVSLTGFVFGQSERKIVLVAGETAKKDVLGHHDYLAGCKCLQTLLAQTRGVRTEFVREGWPQDERVFDGASAVVFYTDGGGKQVFLASPQRVARVQALADADVGLVYIHQAVDFPAEFADQAKSWLGGIYLTGKSGRGHWQRAPAADDTSFATRRTPPRRW